MRNLSVDVRQIRRAFRTAPIVNSLSLDTPCDVEWDRFPCVDSRKDIDKTFHDNATVCEAEELRRPASHGFGRGEVDIFHFDSLMLNTGVVQRIGDHLETFGRLDRFASSVHSVPSFRGTQYERESVNASCAANFTGNP